jgi:hypothetical protein
VLASSGSQVAVAGPWARRSRIAPHGAQAIRSEPRAEILLAIENIPESLAEVFGEVRPERDLS